MCKIVNVHQFFRVCLWWWTVTPSFWSDYRDICCIYFSFKQYRQIMRFVHWMAMGPGHQFSPDWSKRGGCAYSVNTRWLLTGTVWFISWILGPPDNVTFFGFLGAQMHSTLFFFLVHKLCDHCPFWVVCALYVGNKILYFITWWNLPCVFIYLCIYVSKEDRPSLGLYRCLRQSAVTCAC